MDQAGRILLSDQEQESYFRMLWWLRSNPVHRVYLLYGIILAPHQRITYRVMNEVLRMGLKLSRGMSKSFLDGLYLVDKTLINDKASAVVLTRGFRGGKLVLSEACEKVIAGQLASQERLEFALFSLSKPANIINRGADLWQIKWSHGSSITTGPLGPETSETSAMRGVRANTALLLDEAADIGEEHYTSVISPFGRVARDPVGDLESDSEMTYTKIESGTVRFDYQRYTRYLIECYDKMMAGDPEYAVVEFNYEDAFYYENNDRTLPVIFSYRLNLKDLFADLQSGTTSEDDFLSENKNIVQSIKDQEFSPKLIDSITGVDPTKHFNTATERQIVAMAHCPDPVVIGFDPARDSADAAWVVIRIGALRKIPVEYNDVIFAKTVFQKEYGELYKISRDLLDAFPGCLAFWMDKRGGGTAVRDIMWRPPDGRLPLYDPIDDLTPEEVRSIGVPILRVNASTAEENTIRGNFTKAQMESKRFLLPDPHVEYATVELEEISKTIVRLGKQFTYIQLGSAGNWKKYEVEERRLKKDLFSATLLGMQGIRDIVDNTKEQRTMSDEYAWVRL
jgi:hypothetical protein